MTRARRPLVQIDWSELKKLRVIGPVSLIGGLLYLATQILPWVEAEDRVQQFVGAVLLFLLVPALVGITLLVAVKVLQSRKKL